MLKKNILFYLMSWLILMPAFAETVYLKTGQKREGKIIEKTKDYLKMDFYGSTLVYFADEVESINSAPFEKYSPISTDIDAELLDAGMLQEPSADGIYGLNGVTVRIKAPRGWKLISRDGSDPEAGLQFMPPKIGITGLRISVISSPEFLKSGTEQYLRQMMEASRDDPNVLVQEIIPFANTRAISSVSLIGGMKTKQIQFYDREYFFTITFVCEAGDFDAFYPLVTDSLSTFSLVKPAAEEVPALNPQAGGFATPSDELLDKFQNIFEEDCLESVNEFKKMSNAENRPGAETSSIIEMMKKECRQITDKYLPAFILSDAEAKKILSADYDFSLNKDKLKEHINRLMTVRQRLPIVIEYLIQKHYQNKLSGFESEFAVRLFGEYLKDIGAIETN